MGKNPEHNLALFRACMLNKNRHELASTFTIRNYLRKLVAQASCTSLLGVCGGVSYVIDYNCHRPCLVWWHVMTIGVDVISEHIWPVTVKAKGLSGSRDRGIPPGAYRLCLTNTAVSLIRLYSDKPDVEVPVS